MDDVDLVAFSGKETLDIPGGGVGDGDDGGGLPESPADHEPGVMPGQGVRQVLGKEQVDEVMEASVGLLDQTI